MRKIKKTLLTCLIAVFAFTLCLGASLFAKTNIAKADATAVSFVSAHLGDAVDNEGLNRGTSIRFDTSTVQWETFHNWVSAEDWKSIADYTTINGRTVTEINAATTSEIPVTIMLQGAGSFSFLRLYIPDAVMSISDVRSMGILDGWSFTDDKNNNVVYTAPAVTFFRTGDTMLEASVFSSSAEQIPASNVTISAATNEHRNQAGHAGKKDDSYVVNIDIGKQISDDQYALMYDGYASIRKTIYVNGKSIEEWNNQMIAEDARFNEPSTYTSFPQNSEDPGHKSVFVKPVGLWATSTGFQLTILQELVADCTEVVVTVGQGCYSSGKFIITGNKSATVLTQNVVDITNDLTFLDNSKHNPAEWGPTKLYFIHTNEKACWTQAPCGGCLNENDPANKGGGQIQMKSILFNGVSLWDINKNDDGAYGSTQGNIASGGQYAPILVMMSGELGSSLKLTVPTNYANGDHREIVIKKGFNVAENGTSYYVAYDVVFTNVNGTWVKEVKDTVEIETTVEDLQMFVQTDGAFAGIKVVGNDYEPAGNTYPGTAQTALSFAQSGNFLTHVLFDGVAPATPGEAFLNVWNNLGYFTFSPINTNATRFTVLAGCKLPTYNALLTGVKEVYVVTEDVTFIKQNGAWINEKDADLTTSYTVTFKDNAGAIISTQTVEEGATVSAPANPSKAHANMLKEYRFDGWFVGDAQYDFSSVVTTDLEITAKFTEVDKQAEVIDTAVVMAKPLLGGGVNVDDYFLGFELSVNDYAGLDTYGGEAVSAKNFLLQSNFLQKVLINDVAFPVQGETYLNVWGAPNSFTTRGFVDDKGFKPATLINKITILAGCQFPTYEMLSTGVLKYYATTEDITFVVKKGVWMTESEALKNAVRFIDEEGNVISEHTLDSAGTIDRPADPVKTSIFNTYTFEGWFVDGVEFDFDTVIDKDTDITAKFAVEEKAVSAIGSTVNGVSFAVDTNNAKDFFLLVNVAGNDFLGLNTYPAAPEHIHVWTVREFTEESNFYSHVQINGVAMKERGEVFINVWGKDGFSIRVNADAVIDGQVSHENVTSIKFLAGCQFPTYKALREGVVEVLTVLDDVTFTLVDGVWVREEIRYNGGSAEVESYKAGAFRPEEDATRATIVANALTAIASATTAQEVETIVAEAKAAIDELKTNLDYIDEELAPIKAVAREELLAHRADLDVVLRDDLVNAGLEAIANALTEDEIINALIDAKAAIDELANACTIIEDSIMVQVINCNKDYGNVYVLVTLPVYDTVIETEGMKFGGVDIATVLNKFGVWDNILIGEKTLREWGFTAGWNNEIGFNSNTPFKYIPEGALAPNVAYTITIHAHSDLWAESDVEFAGVISNYDVTVKAGATFPGFAYLSGEAEYTVYRAISAFTTSDSVYNFGVSTEHKTDVEDLVIAQDNGDAGSFYLGVGLVNDDYPVIAEEHIEFSEAYVPAASNPYTGTILINGEAGLVTNYALFGLNDGGDGRLSITVNLPYAQVHTITIPAGSAFPAYGAYTYKQHLGIDIYVAHVTSTDVTFVKAEDGSWVEINAYRAQISAQLDADRQAKDGEFFAQDVTAMDGAVATAQELIASATNGAEIAEAYATAKAVLDGVLPKSETIAAAKAEVEGYKAEEGLFRAEEAEARATAVATAVAAIDAAQSREEVDLAVATAKEAIDALTTANEHAKAEIAGDVANAKVELEGYKAEEGLFRAEEAEQRATVVANAIVALDEALDLDTVNAIVADAKANIDALKTDAELTAEEALAAKKEEGLAVVNGLKGDVDPEKYTDREMATIGELYSTAKAAIESATTIEEVDAAVNTFTTELNKVPQIGQATESTPESVGGEEPEQKGCGGAIGGASAMLTIMLLAGAMLLKKKND